MSSMDDPIELPFELDPRDYTDQGAPRIPDEGIFAESLRINRARDGLVEISAGPYNAFVSPAAARRVIAAIEAALR